MTNEFEVKEENIKQSIIKNTDESRPVGLNMVSFVCGNNTKSFDKNV